MLPLKRALAAAMLITVAVAAPAPGGNNPCWRYKRTEAKMIRKVNTARANAGTGKVFRDPELSKVARVHSKAMARRGTIWHQSSSQLGSRVTRWILLGENVGKGQTVKSLHRAFMRSSGHRENIIRPSFRYVGVGTRRAGGYLYVTVIFQARKNPGTTLKMPAC